MRKIVLISCVSKKLDQPAPAQDLYTSTLFTLNLAYARSLNPDAIFILSALHGLVALDEIIAPYDVTLNDMPARARKEWAQRVLAQLAQRVEMEECHFIFLAGQKYRQYLLPHLSSYEIPLQGMRIGEQLQFLKEQTGA